MKPDEFHLNPLSFGKAFGPVGAYLEQITRHDHYACSLLHQAIRQKWPQINPQTAVYKVQNRYYLIMIGPTDPVTVKWPVWKKGHKAQAWRVLGELFRRLDWVQKGRDYEPTQFVGNPVRFPVEWQGFQAIEHGGYPPEPNAIIRVYAAYDAFRDQLIVLER